MVHGIKEDYGIKKEQKNTMKDYQDIGRMECIIDSILDEVCTPEKAISFAQENGLYHGQFTKRLDIVIKQLECKKKGEFLAATVINNLISTGEWDKIEVAISNRYERQKLYSEYQLITEESCGFALGEESVAQLVKHLLADGKKQEVKTAILNEEIRKEIYSKHGITSRHIFYDCLVNEGFTHEDIGYYKDFA